MCVVTGYSWEPPRGQWLPGNPAHPTHPARPAAPRPSARGACVGVARVFKGDTTARRQVTRTEGGCEPTRRRVLAEYIHIGSRRGPVRSGGVAGQTYNVRGLSGAGAALPA